MPINPLILRIEFPLWLTEPPFNYEPGLRLHNV